MIHANPEISQDLQLSLNDPIFYFERVLFSDAFPLCFEIGFVPYKYFHDFSLHVLEDSRMQYIEEKGVKLTFGHHIIHAILSCEKISSYLAIKPKTPLLKIEQINFDEWEQPVEKIITFSNTEDFRPQFIRRRTS